MSPARRGQRPSISTLDLLQAVDWLGTRWTLLFTGWEITSVNEALDRELLNGTLIDATTISPTGRALLPTNRQQPGQGQLTITPIYRCPDHQACSTVRCTRCGDLGLDHVDDTDLDAVLRKLVASHDCTLRD